VKIVIIGDSYSTQRTIIRNKPTTFTWIDCLEKDHEISCLALPGASNVDTLGQVPDSAWDCLIASLSPVIRPTQAQFDKDREEYDRQVSTREHVDSNIKAAYKLTRLPNSIVWSCFEEYQGISNRIHYLPLFEHNELYRVTHELTSLIYTGCHLTRKGNIELYNIMKRLIKKKNRRALRATLSTMGDRSRG